MGVGSSRLSMEKARGQARARGCRDMVCSLCNCVVALSDSGKHTLGASPSSTRFSKQRIPPSLWTVQLQNEKRAQTIQSVISSDDLVCAPHPSTHLAVTPVTKRAALLLRQPTRVEQRVALEAPQAPLMPRLPNRAHLLREVNRLAALAALRPARGAGCSGGR